MGVGLTGVPVFVYHGVADEKPAGLSCRERKYWVSRPGLSAHLRSIRASGYTAYSLDGTWSGTAVVDDARSVVVTFDYEFYFHRRARLFRYCDPARILQETLSDLRHVIPLGGLGCE